MRTLISYLLFSVSCFAQCTAPCVNVSAPTFSASGAPVFTVTAPANPDTLILKVITGSVNANITVAPTLTGGAGTVTFTSLLTASMNGSAFDRSFLLVGTCAGGACGSTLTINPSAATVDTVIQLVELLPQRFPVTIDCGGQNYGYGTGVGTALTANGTAQCTSAAPGNTLLALASSFNSAFSVTVQPTGYIALASTNTPGTVGGIQSNMLVPGASGNQSPTWTLGNSGSWIGEVIALEPVSAETIPCWPAGPDSRCPAVITTSGNIAHTVPLVYGAANVAYSTMGNSAARLYNYSFLAGDDPTSTTGKICIGLPGRRQLRRLQWRFSPEWQWRRIPNLPGADGWRSERKRMPHGDLIELYKILGWAGKQRALSGPPQRHWVSIAVHRSNTPVRYSPETRTTWCYFLSLGERTYPWMFRGGVSGLLVSTPTHTLSA